MVEGLPPLTHTMSQLSYPSAHATTSAAGARAVAGIVPAAAPAAYAIAIAMTASRLYLGVHWPSDSVAGFALGSAVGELAS